jgi:hypothetical protein
MAQVIRDGYYLPSTPANAIHTGAGALRGFLISNNSASSLATVTFFDNTTATGSILLTVNVPASTQPYYIMFPRDHAPRFTVGLSATFTFSAVAVWSINW